MSLISENNSASIETAIKSVHQFCRKHQGALLTEDDFKCLLFRALSAIPAFSEPSSTKEPEIMATYVHAELSWFDADNDLTIKPDITILEPHQLSILRNLESPEMPLPSKACHFAGSAYIFELKFIRSRTEFTNSQRADLEKDLTKIDRLFQKLEWDGLEDQLFCYFVTMSRYVEIVEECENMYREYLKPSCWRGSAHSLDVRPR